MAGSAGEYKRKNYIINCVIQLTLREEKYSVFTRIGNFRQPPDNTITGGATLFSNPIKANHRNIISTLLCFIASFCLGKSTRCHCAYTTFLAVVSRRVQIKCFCPRKAFSIFLPVPHHIERHKILFSIRVFFLSRSRSLCADCVRMTEL